MLKIELEVVAMTRELLAAGLEQIARELRISEAEGAYCPFAVKWDWMLRRGDYLSAEKEDEEEGDEEDERD